MLTRDNDMEKESVTIEIKQEVSITLLWIAAGVILVSAAFFLVPRGTDLWPALNAAGVAAAVYLFALLMFVLRPPLPVRTRITVGIVAFLVLFCTAFAWIRMEDHSRWQAATLMKIREVIGRGIRFAEMPSTLLKTLDAYHRHGVKKNKTLADEFRALEGDVHAGSNIHKPQWEGDDMTVIVQSLEPDRIVLVSQESYVKGRDPSFKNLDGKIGMVQEKYILTERGVTHVSEN